MDYATKAIILIIIFIGGFLSLTQLELLEGIFEVFKDLAKSLIEPCKELITRLF